MTAKRYLEISEELRIPAAEFTTQTIVVYGGKGMGKTNLAAVAAEELAACGQRFAIIDPVGVSWGLRHGAGGRGQGLEILILGGVHGDLPIEPTGGAVVADLVADEDADVLIDISRRADGQMWSNGEKIRFVTEYATRLYQRQGERRRPLMQMIDEAGRFVPQDIPRGADQIAACVGAIEQLVELGRNVGVGVMLITQRSARMKKSVSELAECMVAFRTVGPRSVDAILDWFGEHVEKDRWKDLVGKLRTLDRGEALVVSPGWLQFEGVAKVRKRQTFDSSSTPTGEERKLAKRGARPDLEKYRTRIAETVQKAEASDPSKLRQKLRTVEAEYAVLREKVARLEEERKAAAPAKAAGLELTTHDREQLGKVAENLDTLRVRLGDASVRTLSEIGVKVREVLDGVMHRHEAVTEGHRRELLEQLERAGFKRILEKLAAAAAETKPGHVGTIAGQQATKAAAADTKRAIRETPAPRKAVGAIAEDARLSTPDGELKKPVGPFLQALAQHPDGLTREQAHILAGYQPSGDTSKLLAALLEHGIAASRNGRLVGTAALEKFGPFEPLPTGAELRRHTLERLPTAAERKVLQAFFDVGPGLGVSRAEIHERAGLKPSGDTSKALGKFIKLGWVQKVADGLVAAPEFFA